MKVILLSFLFFIVQITSAQNNAEIKGTIVNAVGTPLEKATVSVISAEDSIVVSYSLSNAKGQFDLVRLPTKKDLILFISHISSSPYERKMNLQPNEQMDLGNIEMGALSLDEVVISRMAPIRLNGDTLEYKADYFKTRPNATVEELLQLLPGLQVNVDGTIFYQGRQVSGIRVNNKDFFADDLTIATKNLDASLVDVVQVIKDRGDSQLEVLDDTELPIILNLKTKKDFLKANFGKFYGSGGTRDRYETGALINTFRDTLQISFIGYANNLSRKGFDYSELSQYGGLGRAENNNSSYMYYGGIQNHISTGINVNYDIQKKLKTNLMYNFEQQNDYTDNRRITNSYYGEVVENGQHLSKYDYRRNTHTIRVFARFVPDTTFRISLDIRANFVTGNNEGKNETNRNRGDLVYVQEGYSSSTVVSSTPRYNHTFMMEKKLNPKLIMQVNQNLRSSSSSRDELSDSYNRFYLFQDSTVDESVRRGIDGKSFNVDNRISLEMKHYKNFFSEYYAKYNWSTNYEVNDIVRRVNSDEFINRNDIANNRKLEEGHFYAGVKIKATIFKKLKAEVGTSYLDLLRNYYFYGKLDDASYRDKYFLSFVVLSYDKLNLQFQQRAESPNIYYFQTVNTGDFYPTNRILISPYFDNELSNQYSIRYHTTLKRSKVNINFSFSYTQLSNSVGNAMEYDVENSYSTSQNYQAGGVDNYYFYGSASKVFLQKKDWKLNWTTNGYGGSYPRMSTVNGQENKSTSNYGGLRNTISFSYKSKVTFSPSYNLNIDVLRNTVQNDFFRDVSRVNHEVGGSLLLNDMYKFRMEASYMLRNQTFNLNNDRENRYLINASLYYPVLKKGELKFTAFDILNQNQNMYIYGNGNSNTFSNNLTLRQYFMVGMVYKFLTTDKK